MNKSWTTLSIFWQWRIAVISTVWQNQRGLMAQGEGVLAGLQIIIYNRLVVFQLCTKASCSFYQFVSAFVNMLESKTEIEMGEMEKKQTGKIFYYQLILEATTKGFFEFPNHLS